MATEAAIQSDVEKNDEIEIVVGNTARNEMMNHIAEKVNKARDEELNEGKEEVKEVVDEPKEEESEIEENKTEKPEVIEPSLVKIKVDGEEKEVPKDKVLDAGIRALQKESSADKRLEEATRLLREIQQKYEQPQQQQAPSQEWDDATVVYALEHGTEEQKAYAVSLLRGRDKATPEAIVQQTTQHVLNTVDFKQASEWFASEYKDIVSDPYLLQLASLQEDRLRADGDKRPRKELYKTIGDELRKWKGGPSVTSMEEKKERKSTIVNLPSASVKQSAPETQKVKSTADVIEDMRKRRGQN